MRYEIYINTEVRDKEGKIIEKRKEKCNTYVKNFLMLLNAAFKPGTSDVVDTGGTTRTTGAKYCVTWNWWVQQAGGYDRAFTLYGSDGGWTPTAPEADDTYGIIVGTSDQAVSASDYNLISKIAHGDSAGQLYHYATTMLEPTVDGNTVRQRFERTFKNNSGADITVKEIGLVVKTSEDNYLVMIIRDVVTPVTVPAAGSLYVGIELKTVA